MADLKPMSSSYRSDVMPDEVAGAFEQHRLDGHDAIASTESGGSVVDDLLLRRMRCCRAAAPCRRWRRLLHGSGCGSGALFPISSNASEGNYFLLLPSISASPLMRRSVTEVTTIRPC